MDTFTFKLRNLVTQEIATVRHDDDKAAAMIEALANALGFTVAYLGRGKPDKVQELLTGVESYVYEAASTHSQFAKVVMPFLDKS